MLKKLFQRNQFVVSTILVSTIFTTASTAALADGETAQLEMANY
jgi:hypothetical protein